MKSLRSLVFVVVGLAAGAAGAQNLLYNANLNIQGTGSPDGWTSWKYGNSEEFADYKISPTDTFSYDGTPYVNIGNWGAWYAGGAGWYQQMPGTVGNSYTFSAMSRTEDWSSPAAELRLIFLDSGANVLSQTVQSVANYAQNAVWTSFSVSAIAPPNTSDVKVEFGSWGAVGTVCFDNASLVTVVPEPGALALAALGGVVLWANRRRDRRS